MDQTFGQIQKPEENGNGKQSESDQSLPHLNEDQEQSIMTISKGVQIDQIKTDK